MPDLQTTRSITGRQITAGLVEEAMPLIVDGTAPAATVAVPANTNVVISDIIPGGDNSTLYRLQQTNDGVTWFTIGALQVFGIGMGISIQVNPDTPWRIDGGIAVAIRVAITTPLGPIPVACVLNGYRVS